MSHGTHIYTHMAHVNYISCREMLVYFSDVFTCRFCDELKPTEHAQLLTPYLAHYIQQLAAMSGEFPEDVVVMVTEALQLVIQVSTCATKFFGK